MRIKEDEKDRKTKIILHRCILDQDIFYNNWEYVKSAELMMPLKEFENEAAANDAAKEKKAVFLAVWIRDASIGISSRKQGHEQYLDVEDQ